MTRIRVADPWEEVGEEPTIPEVIGDEELFGRQWEQRGLPPSITQHAFAVGKIFSDKGRSRMWRFDRSCELYMLAVEIEGLVMKRVGNLVVVGGRHGSMKGIIGDMDKYNAAALLGWTVLRFPQKYVASKRAIDTTTRVLASRGWVQP